MKREITREIKEIQVCIKESYDYPEQIKTEHFTFQNLAKPIQCDHCNRPIDPEIQVIDIPKDPLELEKARKRIRESLALRPKNEEPS